MVKPPSGFRQYQNLLVKDLRQEFHTREMLTSMGIYAVLVLIVFGAALAQTVAGFDILQMSGGLVWVLVIFTSLLGLNRSFAHEKEEGCLEGILLVPLDRSVIFLAKATANLLFLLLVEAIVLPLFFFLFLTGSQLAASAWWAIGPLLAGSIGIAGVGTLLAVLFVPLAFPLLYACVNATSVALLGGEALSYTYLPSLAMAGGYDVVMLAVSWLLYDYVVSA